MSFYLPKNIQILIFWQSKASAFLEKFNSKMMSTFVIFCLPSALMKMTFISRSTLE